MNKKFTLFRGGQGKSVLTLIKNRRWRTLREKLVAGTIDSNIYDVMNIENSGETILHAVCRKNPPEDIVTKIVNAFPKTVSQLNESDQYPIHVASQCGALPKIIKKLYKNCPDAACRCDVAGKTPLHLACEHYLSSYRSVKENMRPKQAMEETISTLTRTAFSVIHLEDEKGMTALEYAIETGTDLVIVQKLQRDTERCLKEQQAARFGSRRYHQENFDAR